MLRQGWFVLLCLLLFGSVWSSSCGPAQQPFPGVELVVGADGGKEVWVSPQEVPPPAPDNRPKVEPVVPVAEHQHAAEPPIVPDALLPPETRPEPSPRLCNEGAKRCAGNIVEVCENGVWSEEKTCASGEQCTSAGVCVPSGPPPNPCAGKCWDNDATFASCGFYSQQEDFGSGRYNVHQYNTQLRPSTPLQVTLTRRDSTWKPTLYVTLKDGTPLTPAGVGPSNIQVSVVASGRTGDTAKLLIKGTNAVDLVVYVTGWSVVDGGFKPFLPKTAKYDLQIDESCVGKGSFAPPGALSGEQKAKTGSQSVSASSPPLRVDANQGEHIGFRLDFQSGSPILEVLAWNGSEAISLGTNNWGPKLRALAALDAREKRTFWVKVRGLSGSATLKVSRTPFSEGAKCKSDCARLLQLPLPMERNIEGYYTHSAGKFVYQFGRRDMLMAFRNAGRKLIAAGYGPFPVKDFSKWDASRPPGHASHTNGKDVDTAVVDQTGPVWKPLCKVNSSSNCSTGTDTGFDGKGMAILLAGFLESGKITNVFLDREFLPKLNKAVQDLIKAGTLPASMASKFKVVQHWPNHHNHAHIRISTP